MATNLTPQQLAELQRLFSTPVGNGNDNAYMPNTVDYDGQSWKRDDTGGFVGTGPLSGNNEYHYTNYGADGAQTAEGDARMSDWDPLTYALMATAGLVGGGLMMGGPGAFGFGGGAGGAGAAGSLAGDAFLPGALGVDGAAMSTGALPGLEGYLAAGSAGGAAGGGTGGLLAGDATMPGQLGVNGANMSSAALPGLEGYVTGSTGLLGSIGKNALGLGATAIGGLLGAQGQKSEQSTAKDIPEWLKPFVNKQLGYAGGLLDKQMAPGYMQGYDDMRSVGQGLLNQPIAGNGFAQFQAMPRFGR